ncbi:MAG: hypothetical protein Q9168_008243 [Polycauliona sp. 1 TL-2023]
MSAPTSNEKKSKSKFSSLFHSKDKPDPTTNPTAAKDPISQRSSNTDSGYGGSDPSVTAPSSHVPPSLTESDESHADSNRDRDNNGQTVTTTTTTTTTTTSGGQPVNTSIENNGPASEYNNGRTDGGGSPPIPMRSSLRDRSPNPPGMQQGNAAPMRDRSPMDGPTMRGSSPGGRTNFSYPNRGGGVMGGQQHMGGSQMGGPSMGGGQMGSPPPMGGPQMTPQQQHNQGTLQGLKNAAVGIHGAGETLRGTLNSAVDRRTGAPADRLAEHDRVLAAGRHEMETGRMPLPEQRQQQMPPKGILKKY